MSIDRNAPHNQPLGKIARFGDAAHGVYRASTGKITSPEGVEIATPGVVPIGGDAHLIRPPGSRPDTRTPDEVAADAAAGRTWLDYGIISGLGGRLYGRQLKNGLIPGWIYCADDGSRWLVRATINTGGVVLSFRPFGELLRNPSGSAVQTINCPIPYIGARGESASWFWSMEDDEARYIIDAMSSTGNKVLITGREPYWLHLGRQHCRGPRLATATNDAWKAGPYTGGGGAWELAIAGIPPAASVTTRSLVFPSVGAVPQDHHLFSTSTWKVTTHMVGAPGGAGGYYYRMREHQGNVLQPGRANPSFSSGSRGLGTETSVHRMRWLAGGYYDNDDSLQLVLPEMTVNRSLVYDFKTEPWTGPPPSNGAVVEQSYGHAQIDWSGEVKFLGVTLPVVASAYIPFRTGGNPTGACTVTLGGVTYTQEFVLSRQVDNIEWWSRVVDQGVVLGWDGLVDEFYWAWGVQPHFVRFSNCCWGLVLSSPTHPHITPNWVIGYFSPTQYVPGPFSIDPDGGPGYATAHPVTGEITASLTESVCVV